MHVILDLGSGKSTHNDIDYVKWIIESIKAVDPEKHAITLKFQLFSEAPPNVPLKHEVFDYAYEHSPYPVTASVFDKESLAFLLNRERSVPFVKIACRPDLYWLIDEVPRGIPVYASYNDKPPGPMVDAALFCVPEYPAPIGKYTLSPYVSDHTIGLDLLKRNKPVIWEKHLVLERDPDNPDAGPFAIDPAQLKEALEWN